MPKPKSKPKRTRTRRTTSKAKPPRAPRGQVGPQTYEQVREVADAKQIPLVKAFDEVAKATGRKASTVAVTYYRIARKMGGPKRRRRGRPPGGAVGNGRRTRGRAAVSRATGVLSRASAAIKELQDIVGQQEREIARLRGQAGLAERIRKAFRE